MNVCATGSQRLYETEMFVVVCWFVCVNTPFAPEGEAPKFKPKLDLPKASENPDANDYLVKRKLNPDNYYYAEKFKEWTNSLRQTFDSTYKDEPRIIIPLFYQNNLK